MKQIFKTISPTWRSNGGWVEGYVIDLRQAQATELVAPVELVETLFSLDYLGLLFYREAQLCN